MSDEKAKAKSFTSYGEKAILARADSVRAKLRKEALSLGIEMKMMILRYANERFLDRLTRSGHGKDFILKGGGLIAVMADRPIRASADLDFTDLGDTDRLRIQSVVREILSVPGTAPPGYESEAGSDGIVFHVDDIRFDDIMKGVDESGLRIKVPFSMGKIRETLILDISHGHAIARRPVVFNYPSILGGQAANGVYAYDVETVLAEKVETMVSRGEANTRLRDYYDVWALSRQRPYDAVRLAESFRATFATRGTPLPSSVPDGLKGGYVDVHDKGWQKFSKENWLGEKPPPLRETIAELRKFLLPLLLSIHKGDEIGFWSPAGGNWSPDNPSMKASVGREGRSPPLDLVENDLEAGGQISSVPSSPGTFLDP